MITALYRFIPLLALFLITSQIEAQQFRTNFKGVLYDDTDHPVPGATLMVLSPVDSTLIQFATTNVDGTFMIKGVPKGDYLLNISFLGLETIFKPITSGAVIETDLGKIIMVTSSKLLTEVQVKADFIPIEITKDTITYNADAFQTEQNSVVEDLLKKLPGIEVQQDGSIKAQGENVEKVLVDGKEFFGDDPKAATKNLPARAIKKVKVYDKKSDIAEFTGVDDGLREKTIDLQLKEEFKKGLFGKAEAGYGNGERYNGKASFNRFSQTFQLSFLGQLNNVNDQGFSFNDQMAFSGSTFMGPGGEYRVLGDMPMTGSGNGLNTTASTGLNFTWQKTKKFNFRSSYFYSNVQNSLIQTALRQNLSNKPYDTEENLEKETTNNSHRFSFNSEIKPDSTQEINVNGRFNFGNGTVFNTVELQNFVPGVSIESQSTTYTDKSSDNLNVNSSATYVRRFGNKGHNIATTFSYNKTNNDNEAKLDALTEYLTTGSTEALHQLQYPVSNNQNWSGQLSLTQPLERRRFFELNYMYNQIDADYVRQVSDVIGSTTVINPELSINYLSTFKIHRPGGTLRYSGDKHNVNLSVQYQISELSGEDNQESGVIVKDYKHILPRFFWRYDIGNGKNFRFNYSTRINPPSITQLSPVVDNSDPLRLYTGNPDLNAEYNHYVNVNFNSFTQFSSTSFFISLNGGVTENKIINSRTTDALFVEMIRPINIGKERTASVYSSFGRPIKAIHSRFNINVNFNYTNTQNLIDNDLIDLDRWTRSGGLSFNNLNSKVLEYNLGGQWTFTDSYYQVSEQLNQNTLQHSYFANLTLTVFKKWKIKGGYNYNLYTSSTFADQALPLMKASVSRYVFPKDKGQIILSVFDVLDTNRGLSRNAQINYIEEIRSNSIGRYAMLSFVYNIRGAGEEPPGGMRMGHRRG